MYSIHYNLIIFLSFIPSCHSLIMSTDDFIFHAYNIQPSVGEKRKLLCSLWYWENKAPNFYKGLHFRRMMKNMKKLKMHEIQKIWLERKNANYFQPVFIVHSFCHRYWHGKWDTHTCIQSLTNKLECKKEWFNSPQLNEEKKNMFIY